MKINKGDTVTLVTHIGEIVGRLKTEDPNSIILSNPRLFVQQTDGAGFAPGICMTGELEPDELTFNRESIVCMSKTNDAIEKGWISATSGIQLAGV